jgi:hypothetical protein
VTSRLLILLLGLSVTCFGREFWNGTREGMSVAALTKLFGTHLKPFGDPRERQYVLDEPQRFCGGDFRVDFGFDPYKPKKGLSSVTLELEKSGNADGKVGDCVLMEFTRRFGKSRFKYAQQGEYRFFGDRIEWVIPNRVQIGYYGHGCRWWQIFCGLSVFP